MTIRNSFVLQRPAISARHFCRTMGPIKRVISIQVQAFGLVPNYCTGRAPAQRSRIWWFTWLARSPARATTGWWERCPIWHPVSDQTVGNILCRHSYFSFTWRVGGSPSLASQIVRMRQVACHAREASPIGWFGERSLRKRLPSSKSIITKNATIQARTTCCSSPSLLGLRPVGDVASAVENALAAYPGTTAAPHEYFEQCGLHCRCRQRRAEADEIPQGGNEFGL